MEPGDESVCGPNQTFTSNFAEFFDLLALVVVVVVMVKMVVVLMIIMVDDDDDVDVDNGGYDDVDGYGGHLLERDVSDRNPLSWS